MLALFPTVPKIQRQKSLKIDVFDYLTRLMPLSWLGTPAKIHLKHT